MKKNVVAILVCVGFLLLALAAAGLPAQAADENSLSGRVSAVDGTSITIVPGMVPDISAAGATGGPGGQGGGAPADGSGKPEGQAPSEGSGRRPEGQDSLTGEEQVITLSDLAVVTIQNSGETSDGTVADIAEGSFVTVTLTDGVATAVVVHQGMLNGNMLSGEVTAINGNEITLSVRRMPGGGQNGPEGGAPTGGPGGGGNSPAGGRPGDGQGSENSETGEEQVITIPDDVNVTVWNGSGISTGTFADIAVGSFIMVQLSESDESVTGVVINLGGEPGSVN